MPLGFFEPDPSVFFFSFGFRPMKSPVEPPPAALPLPPPEPPPEPPPKNEDGGYGSRIRLMN